MDGYTQLTYIYASTFTYIYAQINLVNDTFCNFVLWNVDKNNNMEINKYLLLSNESVAVLCWFMEDSADCRDESRVFRILSHMNQ